MTKLKPLNGKSPKPQKEVSELEKALGMEGKIKQMNFQEFQEVALTNYEKEAIADLTAIAEAAKAKADAASALMQKAQADIQSANIAIATARITQDAIFDLIRRRAGFAGKQNWYDPNKGALIVDPN